MINTEESSLLQIHKALTDFASGQLAHVTNYQDLMNYYSDIILCMPGNVYWLDSNCITIGCNQNVLDMFGLTSIDEFVGLSFDDLARMGQWNDDQAISFKKDTLDVIQSGTTKANVEEPPITYADGSVVYFLTTRVPLFNKKNKVIGIVGISTDITYRKVMENALIVEKEKAEVANKAKKQFLYNMRHDIRTPFTGILGVADLLYSMETDGLKREYIETIRNSSSRLLDYLNEILELSQIEDGNVPVVSQLVNLKETAENCLTMFEPAYKGEELVTFSMHYDAALPEMLFTDEFRIKRILINLLGNAVKFTSKGSIALKIVLEKQQPDSKNLMLNLSVSDTGIGIPHDKQSVIFEKFERLSPSYEGKYKGSGLGLFVVQSLVREMGGEIQLKSELGSGSIFSCAIPAQVSCGNKNVLINKHNKTSSASAPLSKASASIASQNGAKRMSGTDPLPRILLVEDEPMIQLVVAALFKTLHCELDIAETGRQAVYKFQQDDYHLVLMDIGLPDTDGYTVTKRIRSLEKAGNTVPIVALTAHAKGDVHDQCITAGMNEVVSKPLSQDKACELLDLYT